MKTATKQSKLIGLVVLLTMIVLFAVNVSYAYFSVVNQVSGDTAFGANSVMLGYNHGVLESTDITSTSLVVYPVYPNGNLTLNRGESFTLKDGNNIAMKSVYFKAVNGSSYVRFWIDAYVVEDDVVNTSENYGRYFDFILTYADSFESKTITSGSLTRKMYYVKQSLSTNSILTFASGMKMLESAPVSILDKSIRITINFDSVQAENGAYKVVFDDNWGYGSDWS